MAHDATRRAAKIPVLERRDRDPSAIASEERPNAATTYAIGRIGRRYRLKRTLEEPATPKSRRHVRTRVRARTSRRRKAKTAPTAKNGRRATAPLSKTFASCSSQPLRTLSNPR